MSGRPEAKSEVYKYYLVSESLISVRPFAFELKFYVVRIVCSAKRCSFED